MLQYKEFNNKLTCIKTEYINDEHLKSLYNNLNDRDIRIIKLDFEGDIAQIIIKPNGFLIKLYPIACIFISTEPKSLIMLNTDNSEVIDYCKYMLEGTMKINKATRTNIIHQLISHHLHIGHNLKLLHIETNHFHYISLL